MAPISTLNKITKNSMAPTSVFSNNVRETGPTPAPPQTSPLSARNLAFLATLQSVYPELIFKPGRKFLFRPPRTINYLQDNENFRLLLLHELAHALLGHSSYQTSLQRLKLERDAWARTRQLCAKHHVPFSESLAEAELNTYRDWHHQKTLCKTCGVSCLELNAKSLYCPFCRKIYPR